MRRISILLALTLVVAGCGDDSTLAPSTTGPTTTTTAATTTTATTVPPTSTTVALTTTAAPTTTTTAAPTTTTTTTPPPEFSFDPDGLGIAHFGDSPGDVIAAMNALFGSPVADTGWIEEPLCPGPLNRFVEYGAGDFDFRVLFTNGDLFAPAGTEHFYSYRYKGATPVPVSPPQLTVGTKVSELQSLYPGVTIMESPWVLGEWVYEYVDGPNEKLYGDLSGNTPGDVVLSIQGGIGCGE